MKKIVAILLSLPIVCNAIALSKKTVLPGFDKIPLYDVVLFFIEGLQKGYLTTRASSLAFKFFMALFPTIIFLFTLIPYIPIENFQEHLLEMLESVLPESLADTLHETIKDLLTNQRGGLLSFGFIFALYLATNGIEAMISSFNQSYHVHVPIPPLKIKIKAITLLFILILLMTVSIGLIVFSGIAINELKNFGIIEDQMTLFLIQAGKWIVILAFYFMGISCIYYFGSNRIQKFRFISAGSSLASFASIIVSLGFAFYVNNFASYNKLYGSLGILIVLMLWIYLNSLILLVGYELNASIKEAKLKKEV
ncbi:MAG: YihY/virulence factor BrkB family protein [Flavobacteriales bacterium]|nr:YihY/virulence factor BrkB family protein [Flavobacteriales bacterium]